MSRAAVIGLSSMVLAVVVIAAPAPGDVPPRGPKVRITPSPFPTIARPLTRIVEVEIRRLGPELTIDDGQADPYGHYVAWTLSRRQPGTPGAISPENAYYARRTAVVGRDGDQCDGLTDLVDLSPFTRRGFSATRADIVYYPLPGGYTMRPARAAEISWNNGGSGEGYRTVPAGKASRLRIDPGIATMSLPSPARGYLCLAEYRVRLWMRGPADIDPMTGNRITRPRVN